MEIPEPSSKYCNVTGTLALIYLTRCDLYISGLSFQHGNASIEPRRKTHHLSDVGASPRDELAGEQRTTTGVCHMYKKNGGWRASPHARLEE
jgi:hypothetical protein